MYIYDCNEEQADAKNDNEIEEQDNSDLRAVLRKEIGEFDSKSNELRQLATDFDRVASQKWVTLEQLEIEAARKLLT